MAEFCLECLRKLDGINYLEDEFELSSDLDLCEGCGQWKHVVVVKRHHDPFTCLKGFATTVWRLVKF